MDSGSESAFIGSWGSSSSSSFLTPSFGSELDSNDVDLDDEDEFIAQLTRQMADYMLEENEGSQAENPASKHSVVPKHDFQEPSHKEQTRRSYADTVKKSIVGFQSDQSSSVDKQIEAPIQLYQVDNQPRVGGQSQSGSGWGRRGKMNESMKANSSRGKELVNGGKGYSSVHGSSGMRAIFLGGSGSRSVPSGTGVFLPRSATDATDHSRKKPGCSTVLVPTRVLQALEQHFNNMESLSPHPSRQVKKNRRQSEESVEREESKLPQEWIY